MTITSPDLNTSTDQKTADVQQLFTRVANNYNLMNDVMSFGTHRLWKKCFLQAARLKPHAIVADIATGTGDVALKVRQALGHQGQLTMVDPNQAMLDIAKRRFIDLGLISRVEWVCAPAELLPFPDHHFDRVLISFGWRNCTQPQQCLTEMVRILKPGGMFLAMEFNYPHHRWIEPLYRQFSQRLIPLLGKYIAHDEPAYQYLVDSIVEWSSPDILADWMAQTGLCMIKQFSLSHGIVYIHRGYKVG